MKLAMFFFPEIRQAAQQIDMKGRAPQSFRSRLEQNKKNLWGDMVGWLKRSWRRK